MSNQSMKSLLHLNWGYKLGLWTYKLECKENDLRIEKSTGRLHNLISNAFTIFTIFAHLIISALGLAYEKFKPERNIPDTLLVVGGVIMIILMTILHAYRLYKMNFCIELLRNVSSLRKIYCKQFRIKN